MNISIKCCKSAALSSLLFITCTAHAQEFSPVLIDGSELTEPGVISLTTLSTQTTVTMRPSVTSSTLGAGVQKYNFGFACVTPGGLLVPNNGIQISKFEVIPMSGGHDHHDASRPKGDFVPQSGVTNGGGYWYSTYEAPEAAGIIQAELTCDTPSGPTPPYIFTIGVRNDGLEELPVSADYDLVGQTSTHTDNHYGTPTFNQKLVGLAQDYVAAFPGFKLAYNDMSLFEGGIFDLGVGGIFWRPPHGSHRFGMDVDIRLVSPSHRKTLMFLIRQKYAFSYVKRENSRNHWHVRL